MIDMTENGARLGQMFLETVRELKALKQQVESGQDTEGRAAAHLGAFAMLLQNAGLEPVLSREFELMRSVP